VDAAWSVEETKVDGGFYRAVATVARSHKKLTLEPQLPGRFQLRNALAAATVARMLAERGFPIDDTAIENGIRAAQWPGRLERINEWPAVYLDGAHNPAAAKELARFWEESFDGRRVFLVYGAMRDKAVDEIAGLLFPRAEAVIFTEPRQTRAVSAELLAEITCHHARKSYVVRDPAEALERAISMASPQDAVFATGSLFLVGDLRQYWKRRGAGSKQVR
jgi:dihydrofolate synthase/folylpolyglutamate synthase